MATSSASFKARAKLFDKKKTCVNLMVEMKTQLTAMTIDLGLRDPESDVDPKRAIKELIRERVEAVCPEVAVVVLR